MIRWITDSIGTAPWDFAKDIADIEIVDVRDLVDGVGNPDVLFESKINAGVAIARKNTTLVICCEYGMSRSNAIAVGVICRLEGITFNEGLRRVLRATKEAQIKLSVLKTVNRIVGKQKGASKRKSKVLIIDYDDYIGKELKNNLADGASLILNKASNFKEVISNPALLYLFVVDNNIGKVIFISCDGVINTNDYIGKLIVYLKNVLDVCTCADSDLIYMSSLDVFLGFKTKNLKVKTDTIKAPYGNRGIASSFAEDLILSYRKNQDLQATIIRLPVVYGKNLTRPYFISNLIRKASAGINIEIHKYRNNLAWVNLIHVNDLSRFITKVVNKRIFGIYNIDGGESINTFVIARLIVETYQSNSMISFIALESNLVKLNIDLTKVQGLFKWKPRETFYNLINKEKA